MVTRAPAPEFVSIGNGAQLANGTYLNAQRIANDLVVTSVHAEATGAITIVDPSDLSTSPLGTPQYNLSLVTPTLNVSNNLNMAAESNLYLTVITLNMNAEFTSGGTLIDPSRVIGTATQVNVLSNTASLQQAIDIASPTDQVTVQVSPGEYPGDLTISNAQVALVCTNGDTVIAATNLTIGLDSSAATSSVTIYGGTLYVTNAPATGALDVRNGTLTFSGVMATVDNLLLTNGAFSTMIFSNGTLQAGSAAVTNGQPFIVGDGADSATYRLLGGTHSFNNGLRIRNNATLSGHGSISGAVLVDAGGTLWAGDGAGSLGTLTLDASPTLNGNVMAEIYQGNSPSADEVVLSSGTLTYGGTLMVSNNPSSTLASGDSFTLFNASSYSGWFSGVAVPALAGGISWDTNKLATTGVLDIYNFTATPLTLSTPANTPATISALKLANHATSSQAGAAYPTGWAAAAVTTAPVNGGAVLNGDGSLTYTPHSNYSGSDSFTVTFYDGHGWQAMLVSVTVGNGIGASPNLLVSGVFGSDFVLQFAGIPGDIYTVETNSVLDGSLPWVKLGNYTTPANGIIFVTNAVSGADSLYYRTVYPGY